MAVEITEGQRGVDAFLERARTENKFALLMHSIEGCGPCIQLGRLLKQLAVTFQDTVLFGKMMVEDTEANETYAAQRDFEGYPWVYLYDPTGKLVCDDMPIDASIKSKLQFHVNTTQNL
jgi:hypothetical protein